MPFTPRALSAAHIDYCQSNLNLSLSSLVCYCVPLWFLQLHFAVLRHGAPEELGGHAGAGSGLQRLPRHRLRPGKGETWQGDRLPRCRQPRRGRFCCLPKMRGHGWLVRSLDTMGAPPSQERPLITYLSFVCHPLLLPLPPPTFLLCSPPRCTWRGPSWTSCWPFPNTWAICKMASCYSSSCVTTFCSTQPSGSMHLPRYHLCKKKKKKKSWKKIPTPVLTNALASG